MSEASKYEQRGVSSDKKEVHQAIHNMDKGLFPNAFCKILPDLLAGDPNFCNVMHVDTAGTKTALAYLYWKETGDISVWKGIVQDALVMNLDDMACVGICEHFIISSNIARNKKRIPGEILSALIAGANDLIQDWKKLGINIEHAGGETADVGDVVKTVDVGFTALGRISRDKIIENKIKPGSVIVGFASYGQATYENEYNSGMGCNGLTSARHDLLYKAYAQKYPETYDDSIDKSLIYSGSKSVLDLEPKSGLNIGKLILSPTRTYIPVIKEMIQQHFKQIQGIIHCSGGGQTKVMKFVKNLHIIKDQLFPIPPLFELIQKESGSSWREMYQTFNMGHRLEVYTDEKTALNLIEISKKYNIDAKIIGRCETSEGQKLSLKYGSETIVYQYD